MQSSSAISRAQYVEAIVPFLAAFGVDAKEILDHEFVHTAAGISGFVCVKPDDAAEDAAVSVGDVPEFAVKAWPFTVSVESW